MDKKTAEPIFCLVFLIALFLINACARHQVIFEKSHPLKEKEVKKRGVYHVVERHQTLYRICRTYGVDMKGVASINGISDQNKIQTGQRIFIPGVKEVLKVEIHIDDVVMELPEREKEKAVTKKIDFIWPLEGECADFFEETEKKRHQGIDITSPSGVSIKAAAPGTVVYSGNAIRGYGNLIILRHSEDFVTIYAHNQVNLIEEGGWVEKGQIIGKVGQTGRASGPHLHFEIRRNNKAMDPMLFLR
jgi:murein DD-endopeptidase MepM/ murein hydrolase activator NlpD